VAPAPAAAQPLELPGVDHDPWVGDTVPVLQAAEAFLGMIQPTAGPAAFRAERVAVEAEEGDLFRQAPVVSWRAG
jgi:hypothetical protein